MNDLIILLDDDEARIEAMKAELSKNHPDYRVSYFDNAPEMIDFLKGNLSRAKLISLDHDLVADPLKHRESFDPGNGRDVADYLATQEPCCPVILHTTNYTARDGMYFAMDAIGWELHVVIPHDDVEWVGQEWADTVKRILG
jgi:hypothetical protein